MTYTEFKVRYKCTETSRTFFADKQQGFAVLYCPYCGQTDCRESPPKDVKLEVQVK